VNNGRLSAFIALPPMFLFNLAEVFV